MTPGYSGVVIYTRNATCSPIRAEEGITGVLCPPNSSVPFCELPEDERIGGYPTEEQLSRPNMVTNVLDSEEEDDSNPMPDAKIDASTLDSEGRCVILEFPAFVLIGVYCPAYRDESRDSFRMDFLNALDSRIRNLTQMGKRVIVTGDINISKQVIDTAHGIESIRKTAMTDEEFISSPARRLFNQLVLDGVVVGEREEGREKPVLFDVCRSFHPDRAGMYTCWDQKLNARPGNFGSRIDYVLCSSDMQDWFSDSDIQEGLMVWLLLRCSLESCHFANLEIGLGPLPCLCGVQRFSSPVRNRDPYSRYTQSARGVQGRCASTGVFEQIHAASLRTTPTGIRSR